MCVQYSVHFSLDAIRICWKTRTVYIQENYKQLYNCFSLGHSFEKGSTTEHYYPRGKDIFFYFQFRKLICIFLHGRIRILHIFIYLVGGIIYLVQ